MQWPYVLIDWQWDMMSNGGNIIDAELIMQKAKILNHWSGTILPPTQLTLRIIRTTGLNTLHHFAA